jgi:hypothetical protein
VLVNIVLMHALQGCCRWRKSLETGGWWGKDAPAMPFLALIDWPWLAVFKWLPPAIHWVTRHNDASPAGPAFQSLPR